VIEVLFVICSGYSCRQDKNLIGLEYFYRKLFAAMQRLAVFVFINKGTSRKTDKIQI
jgi:hypothetical protein